MGLQYDPALAAADANLTQDQLAARSQAATLPYTPPTTGANTITPGSLAPATLTPYQQTTPTVVPDVSKLYTTPPLTPTPAEEKAQGLTDTIEGLNTQLEGKSAYQQQQDSIYGVGTAQKTISDLNAQLVGIQNDAAAIPLLLEKNASSQGVASPLIDRQRTSLLRDNAIQALTVSSLMAAAQGQLANAQSLSDKAVAAKYDPIQEKITAATNNLNLILNSPNYSLEQKNRAQKQLDAQNEKQDKLDQDKADTKTIQSIALDAAGNGADAVTLQKITLAKTPTEAAQIAATVTQQQTNLKTIQANNVQTAYVVKNGEVQNAKTGYAYTSEADFQQKTGMTVAQAAAKSMITPIAATAPLSAGDTQIVTANGRSLLVNKITGATIKDLGSAYKGTGDGSTTKVTEADSASLATQFLDSQKGGDGKVSPSTWQQALNAWLDDGHTVASFVARFASTYVNPADTQDYAGAK